MAPGWAGSLRTVPSGAACRHAPAVSVGGATHRPVAHPRALRAVPDVLVAPWRRATAAAAPAARAPPTSVSDLRAARARASVRPVPGLLRVPAPDRPRAPCRTVAALMDPPE